MSQEIPREEKEEQWTVLAGSRTPSCVFFCTRSTETRGLLSLLHNEVELRPKFAAIARGLNVQFCWCRHGRCKPDMWTDEGLVPPRTITRCIIRNDHKTGSWRYAALWNNTYIRVLPGCCFPVLVLLALGFAVAVGDHDEEQTRLPRMHFATMWDEDPRLPSMHRCPCPDGGSSVAVDT